MIASRFPRLALAVVALLSLSWQAAAQVVIGRYAGEFLALGAGARALAMGGASVAAPTPASAAYYNPSRLADVAQRHVEFMHASQFDNLYTYDFLSFAAPMPGGRSGGITVLYTRVGDIPITRLADPGAPLSDDNRVIVQDETGDHELALLAAVGRRLGKDWRAGATAKLLFKGVAGESAYGLGFDLGLSRRLGHGIELGAAARDITTSVLAWTTGRTEAILPSLAVGGAFAVDVERLNARLSVAADLEGHFESRGASETVEAGPLTVEPHVGMEYLIARAVALRGGLSGDDLTAGAGIRFSWMSVNAAFQNHEDLGFTHRISLGVSW